MLPKEKYEVEALQAAEQILSVVLRHSNSLDSALGAFPGANGLHLRKIRHALRTQTPLELVLPAFPAKSPNREKTFGHLPDFGEVLGLERLEETCREISQLHGPGARMVICSDGRVFSDLVGVSDTEVSEYSSAIARLIAERGLRHLSTFQMEQVFPGQSYSQMRERLVSEHGRSVAEVKADVKAYVESQVMFNGIHRFLFEDQLVLQPGKSRNRVRAEAKELAYEVILRSNAWSRLVERAFPAALRLSIHPQFSASPKIGYRLVECRNLWGTPWHNVAYLDRTGMRLIKRKEAEALGAELALAEGRYPYFKERGL